MKPRYRGENSNIEDIAGRFDKHLADPEPASLRLTASASITKLSPGVYKLRDVLMILHTRVLRPHSKPIAGYGHNYNRPAKTAKKKGYHYKGALRERTHDRATL
jgi:hypothetical protein